MSKGQFFTKKEELKKEVFRLCKNKGSLLEPSAGPGYLTNFFNVNGRQVDVSFEIDNSLNFIDNDIIIKNFFDYDKSNKFDTIFGNPPYVKQQEIEEKDKIKSKYSSLNLYLYFIEKSFYHLNDNGEIVYIIPREFFTNSRAIGIRELLYKNGTITDVIDYQERKMFSDADPQVIIIRYELGNFSHKTNYTIDGLTQIKDEKLQDGYIKFINDDGITVDSIFNIKVGIVSGANVVFQNNELGNVEIICSDFIKTGKRKKYIFDENSKYKKETLDYLKSKKEKLINRKIKSFNESNWMDWGAIRNIQVMKKIGKCIYVNSKTREDKPFYISDIGYFDGSILALIPIEQNINLEHWCKKLNSSQKEFKEQNILVGNRYNFTQRTLSKFLTKKE